MVYQYMIPVYAYLVKAGARIIENLPEQYKIPVSECLAKEIEKS